MKESCRRGLQAASALRAYFGNHSAGRLIRICGTRSSRGAGARLRQEPMVTSIGRTSPGATITRMPSLVGLAGADSSPTPTNDEAARKEARTYLEGHDIEICDAGPSSGETVLRTKHLVSRAQRR
jgi:hypothetical protein